MASLALPASLPSRATTAATQLDLIIALRRLRSSELHELVDRLRHSDAEVEAAACALIGAMTPPRKGHAPFPMKSIKRFGVADLRELVLGLCLVAPAAQAVALVEVERLQMVCFGWCGRGDGGASGGGGGGGGGTSLWRKIKKKELAEPKCPPPTCTATTTLTLSTSKATESGSPSSSAGNPATAPNAAFDIGVAGEGGGGGCTSGKKEKMGVRRKIKQAIASFLETMEPAHSAEYDHPGNTYRGW